MEERNSTHTGFEIIEITEVRRGEVVEPRTILYGWIRKPLGCWRRGLRSWFKATGPMQRKPSGLPALGT